MARTNNEALTKNVHSIDLGYETHLREVVEQLRESGVNGLVLQMVVFEGFQHQFHQQSSKEKRFSLIASQYLTDEEFSAEAVAQAGRALIKQSRAEGTFRPQFRLQLAPHGSEVR